MVRSGDIPAPPKKSFRRKTRKASVSAPRVSQMTDPTLAEIVPLKKPTSIISSKLRSVIKRLFTAGNHQQEIPARAPREVEISAGRISSTKGAETSQAERIQPVGAD